ncbi:MAG: hypothetical protein OEY56_10510 [Cyclobacteriaceae bacterium]|nr:hypothetical protein [Cyclobacteriaceae bacterium]
MNYEKIIRQSYRIFIQILTDVEKEDEMEIKEDEWIRFFEIHLNPQKETDDTLIQGYVNRIVHYIFNLYDHNLDGYISREEYKLMFSIYHIDPTTSEESFSKLDLNNDNKISKTELISSLTEFFTSSDPQTTGNWIFGPVKFT